MAERLIVCCDGTWNRPEQLDDGRPAPTNVTKFARAIAPHDPSGTRQLCKYIPGVGVEKGTHWRGGIAGFGLSKNVRAAYEWLIENYDPGDELFFVGFSRGAFTARSAVGFVRNCGILRREHASRINEAYR